MLRRRAILLGWRNAAQATEATASAGVGSQDTVIASESEQPRAWTWFEIGLVALVLILHVYAALSPPTSLMNWYTSDDAFYYFKVAQNITSGHGITFDGINITNGFHPLWMLICTAIFWLARYDLLLPLRLLVIISGLFSAGTGIFLFRLLRKVTSGETAMAAAVIWAFLPFISIRVFQGGLESPISAFCLTWLIYLAVDRREKVVSFRYWAFVGLAAGLTILARLDNIFVVLLLGVWFALGFTSPYLRMLAVGDLGSVCLLGFLSYFIGLRAGWCSIENAGNVIWLIGAALVATPLMFTLFGMYPESGEPATWRFYGRTLASTIAAATSATLILIGISLWAARNALPPSQVVLIFWSGIFLSAVAVRLVSRALFGATVDPSPTLPPVRSWSFWRAASARAAPYYLPVAVLLGGYLTWNLLYAGTATPVSGQIKQWWGVLYARLYGSVMNRGLGELLGNQAWALARLPIGFLQKAMMGHLDYAAVPQLINAGVAASVLIVLAAQRKWLVRLVDGLALFALFMGLYVQIFYYTATPYWRPRSWYWAGEMVFVVLLGGILLESVRRALLKFSLIQRHWGIVVAILAGACMLSFAQMIWRDFPYRLVPDDRNNFMNRIHELEANTAPGSLIGMPGGGTTAYFIQGRTIVNLDGLINTNDYFESLRTGTGSQFLDDLGLDYVLAAEDWPDQRPYRRVFSGRLAPVREIGPQYLFRYLAGHP